MGESVITFRTVNGPTIGVTFDRESRRVAIQVGETVAVLNADDRPAFVNACLGNDVLERARAWSAAARSAQPPHVAFVQVSGDGDGVLALDQQGRLWRGRWEYMARERGERSLKWERPAMPTEP